MYEESEHLPSAARSGDPSQFDQYLADIGKDYILAGPLHATRAHVRFTGPFHGQTVVWDCDFVTLAEAGASRNFIDIEDPGPQGVPLRVGLDIDRIDASAIQKMIVMIRNYKNLRYGRHEYGEPRSPDAS